MTSPFQQLLARDAATMLGDFGTTVTNGSATTTGVLEVRDEPKEVGGFVVMERRTVLRLAAGTGGTIASGTRLVIQGTTYRVHGDPLPVAPDGAHVEYTLVGAP